MRIWTYKNADEKAHTFLRRSKNVKKRTKTYEKRILCKFTFKALYVFRDLSEKKRHTFSSLMGTTDARVACSVIFTRPFSNYRVRNFRLLLITRERCGLARWNLDSSLRLMSCMFVPNLEAIGSVTLVFEPENRPPPRLSGLIQVRRIKRSHSKTAKYGKKYFTWLYVLRYPFIPTNPLLAAMRFISFFS